MVVTNGAKKKGGDNKMIDYQKLKGDLRFNVAHANTIIDELFKDEFNGDYDKNPRAMIAYKEVLKVLNRITLKKYKV